MFSISRTKDFLYAPSFFASSKGQKGEKAITLIKKKTILTSSKPTVLPSFLSNSYIYETHHLSNTNLMYQDM